MNLSEKLQIIIYSKINFKKVVYLSSMTLLHFEIRQLPFNYRKKKSVTIANGDSSKQPSLRFLHLELASIQTK